MSAAPSMNEPRPPLVESAAVHLLLVSAVVFAIYPLAWVIALALSPAGMSGSGGALPLPHDPSLANFREVIGTGSSHAWLFWKQLGNSLAVSLFTAVSAVVIATPAAYALARFEFVGKKSGVGALLATQMFPTVASAVPLYIILESLQLLDTKTGLVLVYASTAVPFAIFQLRGAFAAIPIDIEEAAMVDGATRAQAFLKVVLPAARPAMAVTALFAFMSAWNEFILAATLLSKEDAFTLPVVLQRYVGEHGAAWGPFAAGAILVSVPVMALFYLAQRQLVSGLTAGGVKG
jgi:arabinogalactan oligomer/maltooligosaccharide transport system permease protein